MRANINTGHQFWTETFTSSGFIANFGFNTTASSCLTTWETKRMQYINDYAVANSFLTHQLFNEFMVMLRKALTRKTAAGD